MTQQFSLGQAHPVPGTQLSEEVPGVSRAETTWVHVFKSMFLSGAACEIGSYGMMVYLVIKAHVSFQSGLSFPSVGLISKLSGVSERQVKRELGRLEAFGYIQRTRVGRNNKYRLKEKVQITDSEGNPMAIATWDYAPMQVQRVLDELKKELVGQRSDSATTIHIEHLQVNITHAQDNAMVFNIADLQALPADLRDPLLRMARRRWPDDSA